MPLLKNLLFPPMCAGCDTLIPVADWRRGEECFCPDCRAAWELAKLALCPRCGEARMDCRCMPPVLSRSGMETLVALTAYGADAADGVTPVADRLILCLKDKHIGAYETFLASQLVYGVRDAMDARGWSREETVISYCPRGPRKVRASGTDQAGRIAEKLAHLLELPCVPLFRHVGDGEQKRLGEQARAEHAHRAYRLRQNVRVAAKRVILVDDIVTTGASMAACCELLLEAGALSVIGVAVARTQEKQQKMPSDRKKYQKQLEIVP